MATLQDVDEQIAALTRKIEAVQAAQKPPHLRLQYFNAPGRAEPIRMALHYANIPFDDERIEFADWPAKKASMPFESMPVLHVDHHKVLAQSNAILAYVGKLANLYPTDPFLGGKVDEVMCLVEDSVTQAVRPDFGEKVWPRFAAYLVKLLEKNGKNSFFVGDSLTVADLKVLGLLNFLLSGFLKHVPTTCIDSYPELLQFKEHMDQQPKIAEWIARQQKK